MSLIYNATFDSGTRVLSLLDKAGNTISSCEVPSKELVDDPNKPLMLRAIEDNSSVTLRMNGTLSNTYQTSTNGTDWTDYTLGTGISLNKGESVYFRCSNHPTTQTDFDYVHFTMRGKIEAWHNAYSMISSDFSSAEASVGEYGMNGLFEHCQSLTKAPLLLNALGIGCYYGTFIGCTSLTKAPSLPATNLARGCYKVMFGECVSLTQAPELPATTLADNCYERMFSGCRSLKEVRVSATTTATDALKEWLSNVSVTGDFYCDPNATIFPTGTSGIPKNWRRLNINEEAPAVDDITKPLTFKATQDGSTVKLTKIGSPSGDFQTSRDGGNTWTDYTIDTAITLNTGDEVSFRAKTNRSSGQDYNNNFHFEMTGKIEAWHNVMSLYRTNDFATYNIVVEGAFYRLFYICTSLTKAPVLPATTLADDCYGYMFSGCGSLNEVHCQMSSSYSSSQISSTYAKGWLEGVSSTGTFYTNADANWPSGASGIPTGWTRVNEETPTFDDITKPLTFRATQDGSTVYITRYGSPTGSFQTSRDGGNTWTNYTIGRVIALNTGDEVSFRAKDDRSAYRDNYEYFSFAMTGKIEAWHNVMSLYRTKYFATYKYAVNYAFNCLFNNCTSLTKAPVLPATSLDQSCYESMFFGCQSLTKAPELPATTLADNCYERMFSGCQSLTKAPELPATTLANSCYEHMFSGCRSLTKAPELPATTLANSCYERMFSSCQSLKEVRISATKTAPNALGNWLYGVSATGDFYCDPNATIFPTGSASGIPENWTRHNIADYPN